MNGDCRNGVQADLEVFGFLRVHNDNKGKKKKKPNIRCMTKDPRDDLQDQYDTPWKCLNINLAFFLLSNRKDVGFR